MIDWHNRTLIAGAAAVLISGFCVGFLTARATNMGHTHDLAAVSDAGVLAGPATGLFGKPRDANAPRAGQAKPAGFDVWKQSLDTSAPRPRRVCSSPSRSIRPSPTAISSSCRRPCRRPRPSRSRTIRCACPASASSTAASPCSRACPARAWTRCATITTSISPSAKSRPMSVSPAMASSCRARNRTASASRRSTCRRWRSRYGACRTATWCARTWPRPIPPPRATIPTTGATMPPTITASKSGPASWVSRPATANASPPSSRSARC